MCNMGKFSKVSLLEVLKWRYNYETVKNAEFVHNIRRLPSIFFTIAWTLKEKQAYVVLILQQGRISTSKPLHKCLETQQGC